MFIEEISEKMPSSAGVYFMFNKKNEIIYIGKAKNLKNRVSSYFHSGWKDYKTIQLVSHIHHIEFIPTEHEASALLLERQMIGKYKPKYNILLKDDKNYSFICIHEEMDFPTIAIEKKREFKKKASYFGPFPKGSVVGSLLEIGKKIFQLRTCRLDLSTDSTLRSQKHFRPCTLFHIDLCSAPCRGQEVLSDYLKRVQSYKKVLSGKIQEVHQELTKKIQHYANEQIFDLAQKEKENLENLEYIQKNYFFSLPLEGQKDFIACYGNEDRLCFSHLKFFDGYAFYQHYTHVSQFKDISAAWEIILEEVAEKFLWQQDQSSPLTIIVSQQDMKKLSLDALPPKLQEQIRVASSSTEKEALQYAEKKARAQFLDQLKTQELSESEMLSVLEKMQKLLFLPELPIHIEIYDISNLGDHFAVGAISHLTYGKKDKQFYRHFHIKHTVGQNDFAMLQEVIERRFHLTNLPSPQLLLIDGGIGQVRAVEKTCRKLGWKVPCIGLAKKEELLIIPHKREPLKLQPSDPVLQILVSGRDEVHRFANRLHQVARKKGFDRSLFLDIPSIGEKKLERLFQTYSSIESIAQSLPEDIQKCLAISLENATMVVEKAKEFLTYASLK